MKFCLAIPALLSVSISVSAQNKIPKKISSDIPALTTYLTENLETEEKKVRAAYEWITANIASILSIYWYRCAI